MSRFLSFLTFLALAAPTLIAQSAQAACPALLNHQFARLQDEAPQSLCQYSGNVVLVVNTASFCGFTEQYKTLEALYAQKQKDGLVVLGFPSNDFGAQEPGTAKEIAALCNNTFGVKFPMFAKSVVKGKQANALFAELAKTSGSAPQWNFHKYLIGRDGKTVTSHASSVSPDSSAFVAEIDKQLKKAPQ